ncbi:MAG: DUF1318 domain-containing protein [Woeseiaceae bacterium]|nr:DUF1318 domain-containing protein [Woeseiaceae bacterium]
MSKVSVAVTLAIALVAVSCVTINVYFPEAAAVEAADRIIDKVRGEPTDNTTSRRGPADADSTGDKTRLSFAARAASFLVRDAHAQANVDFDRPSPEKRALEDALAARFAQLKPWFDSGAIGHTDAGLVDFRDRNLVPLKDRNKVVQLIAEQNNDWNALFREIARLNGHPEWEDSIRRTFAERWVAKADPGWYYREGGTWKQK